MYVARDKDGTLCIYKRKPNKYKSLGQWGDTESDIPYVNVDDTEFDLFPEVKWSDPEPRELVLKVSDN